MISKEFLREDTTELQKSLSMVIMSDSSRTQLLGTVEQIKLHCQPFLNEIEDPFSLLRGLRPTEEWAVNKAVRLDDRKPMSTPPKLHNDLNTMFTRMFGAPFRNAMFCTGNKSQASVYGMIFAIFPIGEYKYIWSPEIRDLYQKFDEWRADDPQEDFMKIINWDSYRSNGLNDAVYKGHEIMLRTKSYYGLSMNNIWRNPQSGPLQNAIQEYWMQ